MAKSSAKKKKEKRGKLPRHPSKKSCLGEREGKNQKERRKQEKLIMRVGRNSAAVQQHPSILLPLLLLSQGIFQTKRASIPQPSSPPSSSSLGPHRFLPPSLSPSLAISSVGPHEAKRKWEEGKEGGRKKNGSGGLSSYASTAHPIDYFGTDAWVVKQRDQFFLHHQCVEHSWPIAKHHVSCMPPQDT